MPAEPGRRGIPESRCAASSAASVTWCLWLAGGGGPATPASLPAGTRPGDLPLSLPVSGTSPMGSKRGLLCGPFLCSWVSWVLHRRHPQPLSLSWEGLGGLVLGRLQPRWGDPLHTHVRGAPTANKQAPSTRPPSSSRWRGCASPAVPLGTGYSWPRLGSAPAEPSAPPEPPAVCRLLGRVAWAPTPSLCWAAAPVMDCPPED